MIYAHTSDPTPRPLPDPWIDAEGATHDGLRGLVGSLEGRQHLAALGWYPVRHEALPAWATSYAAPVLDLQSGELGEFVAGPVEIPEADKLARVRTLTAAELIIERSRRIDESLGPIQPEQWRPHLMTTAEGVGLLALSAMGVATQAEEDALVAHMGALDGVQSIRAAAALIQADIDAAADWQACEVIRAAITTDGRWPQ